MEEEVEEDVPHLEERIKKRKDVGASEAWIIAASFVERLAAKAAEK